MSYERLTPRDIIETINMPQDGDLTRFIGYAMRLHELENQIEKGGYVKLPCRVGDTVYTMLFAASWQVQRIDIYRDKILIRLGNEGTDDYCCVNAKDFGTDWFFTKDEAVKAEEARLKELRGGA